MTTLEKLKAKSTLASGDKVRMPSISSIAKMLTEMGISYSLDNTTNVVEYRSAGRTYVNSRHNGKEGKKLTINMTEDDRKGGFYHIELDSSDSYYSWNTSGYAFEIVKFLKFKGKNK